jgi:pilus assembly protein CpaE
MGESYRILIADDAAGTRRGIRDLLTSLGGYEVVGEATHGLEAMAMAKKLKPDVVLMDVNMPGCSGLEAAADVAVQAPETAVIMISIEGDQEYMRRAMQAGAQDYLVKPFTANDLKQSIERSVDRVRRLGAFKHSEPTAKTAEVITFFSTKGGCGKTSLAVNLAAALAGRRAKRVCLIDLNLRFGDACFQLNLFPKRGIADLVSDTGLAAETMNEMLIRHQCGLYVLPPAVQPEYADYVTGDLAERVLDLAKQTFDVVVVDTAPNLADETLAALDASTKVVLVGVPELPALRALKGSMDIMKRLNYDEKNLFLLLNKAEERGGFRFADIKNLTGRNADFFMQPEEALMAESINLGQPVVLARPAERISRRFMELSTQLLQDGQNEQSGMLRRLKPIAAS